MDTKSIGFASNLVPLILDGSKTLTYRLGDKFEFLKIGDSINFHDSQSGKICGKIQITEKSHAKFKDLPINRTGHEVYQSKKEQRSVFTKYYGKISDDVTLLILGFRLLP